MNHLEATFKGRNGLWRYVVMVVAVFLVSNTIGSIPLLVSFFLKAAQDPGIAGQLAANPNDFSILGLDPYSELSMMMFPFIAGLIAFILLIRPLNGRTFKQTINGTSSVRWKHFFISFAAWFVLSAGYLVLYLKIDPSNFALNNTSISLLFISLIAVVMIPFQASFEEVLFRGYLMQGFSAIVRNRWFPLVMTSILFGLMHSFNPEVKELGFMTMMPQYILFGLVFGLITVLDDGIEAAMGAHTANNIFLVITVTNKSSAIQSPALYEQLNIHPWTEFTGLLVSGILLLIILKFIFKWRSFSILFEKIRNNSLQD